MSLFNPSPRSVLEYLPELHDLRSLEAVSEQPGDRKDQNGRPFVGPAGLLLDNCLESAHPSAILGMPEPEAKEAEIASLVADLKLAAQYVSAPRAK